MALSDFFRINLPYGLKRNQNGEWIAFNREYMPLGYNSTDHKAEVSKEEFFSDKPYYTPYKGLTESAIMKFIDGPEMLHKDEQGNITRVFLYNDRTNPRHDAKCWDSYFKKIKALAGFEVKQVSFA